MFSIFTYFAKCEGLCFKFYISFGCTRFQISYAQTKGIDAHSHPLSTNLSYYVAMAQFVNL